MSSCHEQVRLQDVSVVECTASLICTTVCSIKHELVVAIYDFLSCEITHIETETVVV